jgi:RNA polymerase sigma-70 factor (ECF subfamily)
MTISAESFAAALEEFRDRIRLFAARRLRDWSEAEDVAQEALRRALEAFHAGRIVNPDALPAFLYQTAVHICQHRGRSAGREARALRRVGASNGPVRADAAGPLEALISAERQAAVRRALERLDAGDREVLTMTYADALEAAEIGRRLNLSAGNVRVRRHRALRRLAELLGVTSGAERGLKG